MSGSSDRRKNDKLHPAVLRAKLDAEVWRDPRDCVAALRWLFWHGPYFELCPENPERDGNQQMRAYLSRYLDEEAALQAPDGHLGTQIGLKKGKAVSRLMIVAGDIEGAERLAKRTGLPLEVCVEAYSRVNLLNLPSYMGGDLIHKGVAKPPPSARAALDALRYATVDHTQALGGNGIDPQITKARVDQATTQCHVEMVKAARARPVAVGDRGVIAMMGPGGRP